MEATIKENAVPEAKPEELPLVRQKANLRADRREIKGRIYDLQFDGLSEADFEAAKQGIYDEYARKESAFKENVVKVKEALDAKKLEIGKATASYKAAIEEIKASEFNTATPEELEKAKETFEGLMAKEKESYETDLAAIKADIAAIKEEAKQRVSDLKREYAEVKKTPMKRADKASKLDTLKSEIYHVSGEADLRALSKEHEMKALVASHKEKLATYKNDYNLVRTRMKTLIKNKRAEMKKELAPLKAEADSIRQNYTNVAPVWYRFGVWWRNWGIRFANRQKNAFTSWNGFKDWFVHNAVYLIVLILAIVTAANRPGWLNIPTIIVIIKNTAALLPLSLGVAGCIVLAGTDLSLGRVWGLTALMSGILLGFGSTDGAVLPWTTSMPWIWILVVLVIVMAIGGLCGAFNGFFTAKFSIHPFIVTLASQLIVYGVILFLGNNMGFSVLYRDSTVQISADYHNFVSGGFTVMNTKIEWYVFYAIILVGIMWFVWNKTKFGKSMFAVGCNPEAANVSGISSFKTIILTFTLAGILYGFGGFIYNPINGGAQLGTGQGGELDPITAAVIGGVSFTGGIGKISGVVLGSALLKIIDSCLLALGADTAYMNIVKGAIILIAVSLDMKKYVVKK